MTDAPLALERDSPGPYADRPDGGVDDQRVSCDRRGVYVRG